MTNPGRRIHKIQKVRLRLMDRERRMAPSAWPAIPDSAVCAIFSTCVRDIVFVDDVTGATPQVLTDGAAYARLVEVVCGLHSPMAGETQVQGQFKTFLDRLDDHTHAWLRQLGQHVLADAGRIRDTHLRDLGSRTYGSAVRRLIPSSARVAIIGAGALAREIHDYVAQAHEVDVWTRDRLQQLQTAHDAMSLATELTALVVAAPVGQDVIARVAAAYPSLGRIIDLRALEEATPLPSGVPSWGLADVFGDTTASQATLTKVARARSAAQHCGHRFDAREQLRPFGWEDLCA